MAMQPIHKMQMIFNGPRYVFPRGKPREVPRKNFGDEECADCFSTGVRAVTDPSSVLLYEQIFARHEAVLCSHMEMLSLVKGQIAPEIAAFQTVSSMVNKTVQAMNQLKIARKQMVSGLFDFTLDPFTDGLLAQMNNSKSQKVPRCF
jgi:hypothetical protein